MRFWTLIAGPMRRCGLPQLLAMLLALALVTPSVLAVAHTHDHARSALVVVNTPAHDADDAQRDGTCTLCHVHCGCHIGMPTRDDANGLTLRLAAVTTMLTSDQQRPSATNTRLIRPPKA